VIQQTVTVYKVNLSVSLALQFSIIYRPLVMRSKQSSL